MQPQSQHTGSAEQRRPPQEQGRKTGERTRDQWREHYWHVWVGERDFFLPPPHKSDFAHWLDNEWQL